MTGAATRGARIAAVGQRLAGDDGVGPAVLDYLRACGVPPGVTLHELREPSALWPLLDGGGPLVIVDAVVAGPAGGGGPEVGRVLELGLEDLEARGLRSVSSHGLSVGEALALATMAADTRGARRAAPRVRIVAVTIALPARAARTLSPAVAEAIPRAAERALALARGLPP